MKPMNPLHPLAAITTARQNADSIIVAVSGGKDSLVTLDLCRERFPTVAGYFMYTVPGLGFQERYLEYLCRRFGIVIRRVPSVLLSAAIQSNLYRQGNRITRDVPVIQLRDVYAEARRLTGLRWMASGEKCCDSLDRRQWLKPCAGIKVAHERCYPVAMWSNAAVFNHLKRKSIALPPDYRDFGRSFSAFNPDNLAFVADRYPEDYARILNYFPHVEALVARRAFRLARAAGRQSPPEVHDGAGPPLRAEKRGLQPEDDR